MSEWGRDPLQILLARESRTCRGCIHVAVAFDRQFCNLGKKFGRRCPKYQEVKKTIQGKPC